MEHNLCAENGTKRKLLTFEPTVIFARKMEVVDKIVGVWYFTPLYGVRELVGSVVRVVP